MQLACLSAASKRGNVICFFLNHHFSLNVAAPFELFLGCTKGKMMYVGGGFQRKVVGGDVNA